MWAALNAMDCPVIMDRKGDQMWQKTEQWIIQLSLVAKGTKCGSSYTSAMDGPAILASTGTSYIIL